jgi:hypothetical protein
MPPQPYGPNTNAVRRLLQRLAALPPEEWARLAQLYEGLARTASFAAADRALGESIAAAGREAEGEAVVGPVVQLATDAAERVARAMGGEPAPEPARSAEPALAASLAVIARDLLDEPQFQLLYGPVSWAVPPGELGR